MAFKVRKSAKLAYYTVIPKELEAFGALQCALEPRGGQIGPPDGSKGAPEGSKTIKISREYASWADSGT